MPSTRAGLTDLNRHMLVVADLISAGAEAMPVAER
jgi:hypothetical protein